VADIVGGILVIGMGVSLYKYERNPKGFKAFRDDGWNFKDLNKILVPRTAEDRKWWAKFKTGVNGIRSRYKTGKASEGKKSNEGSLNHGTPDGVAGGTTKNSPPGKLLSDESKTASQPPASTKGQSMKWNGVVGGSPPKTSSSGKFTEQFDHPGLNEDAPVDHMGARMF